MVHVSWLDTYEYKNKKIKKKSKSRDNQTPNKSNPWLSFWKLEFESNLPKEQENEGLTKPNTPLHKLNHSPNSTLTQHNETPISNHHIQPHEQFSRLHKVHNQ